MSFRLVPKSVTLNDLERRNGYQAVVEDLFYNTQRPDRVGSRVKNPDPVPSLVHGARRQLTL